MNQVLITGASRGIGREVALELASTTVQMILVARSSSDLEKVSQEVKNINPNCDVKVITADLSREVAIQELSAKWPSPDAVILNAGHGVAKQFLSHEISELKKMMDLNCVGLTTMCLQYGQAMKAKGHGHLVLIGSMAGFLPTPYMSVYAATKAYVVSLGESLREELRPFGIAVSTICPGGVQTDFANVAGLSPKLMETYKSTLLTPKQVALCVKSALGKKGGVFVPGLGNKYFLGLMRFLPRQALVAQVGKIYRKHLT